MASQLRNPHPHPPRPCWGLAGLCLLLVMAGGAPLPAAEQSGEAAQPALREATREALRQRGVAWRERRERPAVLAAHKFSRRLKRKALGALSPAEQQRFANARAAVLADSISPKNAPIGLVRPLEQALVFLGPERGVEWYALPGGGWAARAEITSLGARHVRLSFRGAQLPEGLSISVLNAMGQAECSPLGATDFSRASGGQVWTGSTAGDYALVELYLPPGGNPATLPARLELDALCHKIPLAPKGSPVSGNGEDPCHNDLTCEDHAAWHLEGSAVAYVEYIDGGLLNWFSGVLVNDADPTTQLPYFLTAHHCISNPEVAANTEYWWHYQSTVCDTAVELETSGAIKTDSGATLVETWEGVSDSPVLSDFHNPGTDFTLLLLAEPPPPGVFFAGWTTTLPGAAASVTAIHHPAGAYKRISYGTLGTIYGYYWSVAWGSGSTEKGSSGSPLFDSAGRIIGQLWGGNASCFTTTGRDYFGRFDKTYPMIAPYLDTPYITAQPGSAEIVTGGTAQLEVAASASTLAYQWYQGTPGSGTPIPGAESASYSTPALSGNTTYYVVVRNNAVTPPLETTSEPATVTVFADAYQLWASQEGIAGAAPGDDDDLDTLSNGLEFVLGLNPQEPSHRGLPTAQFDAETGQPLITFSMAGALPAGAALSVLSAGDLDGPWLPATLTLEGLNVTARAGNAMDPARFFKVEATFPD